MGSVDWIGSADSCVKMCAIWMQQLQPVPLLFMRYSRSVAISSTSHNKQRPTTNNHDHNDHQRHDHDADDHQRHDHNDHQRPRPPTITNDHQRSPTTTNDQHDHHDHQRPPRPRPRQSRTSESRQQRCYWWSPSCGIQCG